jgi:two-component system chemotaxis response regulator CheB
MAIQDTLIPKAIILTNTEMPIKPKLIVIGVSTGGPEALTMVFKSITEKVSVPMLIVQHMPALFTEKLAMMLTKLSPVEVREAKNGDKLTPGVCLIAPGDYHMTITKSGEILLDQNEKVCFVRPSVDVLLNSVEQNFDKQVLYNFNWNGRGWRQRK